MSMAPVGIDREAITSEDSVMPAFLAWLTTSCRKQEFMAGLPTPSRSAPEIEELGYVRYRWDGKTGAELFAGSGAEQVADILCAPPHAQRFDTLDREGVSLDATGERDRSLIDYSMACRNLPALRWLLENGASPNPPVGDNYPPLVVAAKTRDPAFLRLLLAHGADPSAKGVPFSALEEAWLQADQWGDYTNFELLEEAGADLGTDLDFATMWARWLFEGRWDLIEQRFDRFRGNPAEFAEAVGRSEREDELDELQRAARERVKLLIEQRVASRAS
jgi:hypothetical protein